MPGVRLGAFPGRVRRGDLNLDLEGALFGLLEGLKAAEKPRGQGPGKAPGMESVHRARVLGRLGRRARSPRTKTAGTVGSTDAAQCCPNELGACGANKLSCSGGAGAGAAGWRLLPRASALLHLPAFNLRPAFAHPCFLPSPARLYSLRLLISLLSPPPSPSSLSPPLFSCSFSCLFFCILSSLAARCFSPPPGRRGGGKSAAPGACAAQWEAFLLLLPGNLVRLYVRARVSLRRKR